MNWEFKQPAPGDMVRVKLGNIYHYGVFVGEDEIIQFGLAPSARPTLKDSEIEVIASDLGTFLCGGRLEVAVSDDARQACRTPEQVIAFARQSLGRRGYHILKNNCEHFAYECVTGTPYCSQTADVRALFRSLPVVHVYVAPSDPQTNGDQNRMKKLLEYALGRTFGLRAEQLTFAQTKQGRWTTEKCSVSVSRCEGALAVAISRAAVGVQILPADACTCGNQVGTLNVTVEERAYVLEVDTDTPEAIRTFIVTDPKILA